MIQRIQTLFLFAVAVITGLLFVYPVATIMVPNGGNYEFYAYKVTEILESGVSQFVTTNIYSLILTVVTTLLPLVIIFLYKKRLTQIRFIIVEIIFQGGLLFFLWLQCSNLSEHGEIFYRTALIFPIIAIILCLLSINRIGRDIALLKSFDRIR